MDEGAINHSFSANFRVGQTPINSSVVEEAINYLFLAVQSDATSSVDEGAINHYFSVILRMGELLMISSVVEKEINHLFFTGQSPATINFFL